jgi:hypothetical protein
LEGRLQLAPTLPFFFLFVVVVVVVVVAAAAIAAAAATFAAIFVAAAAATSDTTFRFKQRPVLRACMQEGNSKVLEAAGAVVTAEALPWGDLERVYEVAPSGCDLVLGADLLCKQQPVTDCVHQQQSERASPAESWSELLLLLPDNPENFGKLLETLHELAQIRSCPVFVATEQRWELDEEGQPAGGWGPTGRSWLEALARCPLEVRAQ